MPDYNEFNRLFPLDRIKADLDEINNKKPSNGGQTFVEVPPGTYTITVEQLELGKTGEKSRVPGTPAIKAKFDIHGGEYDGKAIWMTQTIAAAYPLSIALDLLASFGTNHDIHFDDYRQFGRLVEDIKYDIRDKQFTLYYGQTAKGFKTYSIR